MNVDEKMEVVKPGYKTTEFWLSTAVVSAGVLLASGAVDGGLAGQIVGGAMAVLKGLGYTWSRAVAKVKPKD